MRNSGPTSAFSEHWMRLDFDFLNLMLFVGSFHLSFVSECSSESNSIRAIFSFSIAEMEIVATFGL